jgi:hypothetical protein
MIGSPAADNGWQRAGLRTKRGEPAGSMVAAAPAFA